MIEDALPVPFRVPQAPVGAPTGADVDDVDEADEVVGVVDDVDEADGVVDDVDEADGVVDDVDEVDDEADDEVDDEADGVVDDVDEADGVVDDVDDVDEVDDEADDEVDDEADDVVDDVDEYGQQALSDEVGGAPIPAGSGPRAALPARLPRHARLGGSLARVRPRRERRLRRLAWLAAVAAAAALVCASVAPHLFGISLGDGNTTKTSPSSSGGGGGGKVKTSASTFAPGEAGTTTESGLPSATQARALLRLTPPSALDAVVEDGGAGYAADDGRNLVMRFDPATGTVNQAVGLGAAPGAMILAEGNLWVADPMGRAVVELSGFTLQVVRTVILPVAPTGLAELDGTVWAASDDGEITPVTISTGSVGAPIAVPGGAATITEGFGYLWVAGTSDIVTRIALLPFGPPLLQSVTVGQGPAGVVAGSGSIWVANAKSGTVSQIDPDALAVTATLPAGTDPTLVAVGNDGRVYVASGIGQSVVVVAPVATGPAKDLGTSPDAMVAAGRGVWVAGHGPGAVVALH